MELEQIAKNIIGRSFPQSTRYECVLMFMLITGKTKHISKQYIDNAIKLKIKALQKKNTPESNVYLDKILSLDCVQTWYGNFELSIIS